MLRRAGCLAFGIIWAVLFLFLLVANSFGDCGEVPGCEARHASQERIILWAGLAALVIGGWLFYRREMKSDDF